MVIRLMDKWQCWVLLSPLVNTFILICSHYIWKLIELFQLSVCTYVCQWLKLVLKCDYANSFISTSTPYIFWLLGANQSVSGQSIRSSIPGNSCQHCWYINQWFISHILMHIQSNRVIYDQYYHQILVITWIQKTSYILGCRERWCKVYIGAYL